VSTVLVALDGSPFAERALPVASWAATALGADLALVGVADSDEAATRATRYLERVGRPSHADHWDVRRGSDAAATLAAANADPATLVCLATHGRDRSAALVGSTAVGLLRRSDRPVLVAGPLARPVTATDAPVVAALDASGRDDALLPVALGWAQRLGRRLVLATVAEPAPPPYGEAARARAERPARHLAALAERCAGGDVPVGTQLVPDPISVHDGLLTLLDRLAALVVQGTHRRRAMARAIVGSNAARVVHHAEIPALVVPLRPLR
jgi:nucleotide-binding universal stress UspA family protein